MASALVTSSTRPRARESGGAAITRLGPWLLPAAVALGARAIVFVIGGATLTHLEPSVVAASLEAGRGFAFPQYGTTYYALKEPLYIALLAAVARLHAGDLPILLVQWLFGAAAAGAVALLTRYLTRDVRAATAAGVIAALNPFLVHYDTSFVHPLSMDTFFFVLTTAVNVDAAGTVRPTFGRVLGAGLVTGLALWQRATLMCSGAAVWGAALFLPRRARRFGQALVWAIVALAVVTPWLVRNYVVLGRVVITSDAAHILWLGNNELSNGTYSDSAGRRVFDVADPGFKARILGKTETQQMDAFYRAVWTFIVEHPERFAALVVRRLVAFFWLSSNAGVDYTPGQIIVYILAYALLLVLGLQGFRDFWRTAGPEDRRRAGLVFASVLGLAALHALVAINTKHRAPWEMVLAIFAGIAVARRFARPSTTTLRTDHPRSGETTARA
jgi:hypothetical protein